MCLLSSRRSSIVSVLRDLSAVSVDSWLWSPHRLLSPPPPVILDLSRLASEGPNGLQRRRARSIYSLTLTSLHATQSSPALVSFACTPAACSHSCIIEAADSGESGRCGAVRRCQAHFSSAQQRSGSAVSPHLQRAALLI